VRIERIGSATLYLADCRDVLPTLQGIDVILTDPVWPRCPTQTIPGSERPYELWAETCAAMPAPRRVIVVMRSDCDPRFLQPTPGAFFRAMILPYVIPGYLGRALGGDEIAYWFGECIRTAKGRMVVPGRGPLVQPGFKGADDHPMMRPQPHFDWLVNWCADAGETVCDPMMGGATTGVACVKVGQPFVGIEIHPPFFDIACRRIEQAQRQRDLFIESPVADDPQLTRQGDMWLEPSK
jgi:site-specific DNA-methyltransferase (adenine-specific)